MIESTLPDLPVSIKIEITVYQQKRNKTRISMALFLSTVVFSLLGIKYFSLSSNIISQVKYDHTIPVSLNSTRKSINNSMLNLSDSTDVLSDSVFANQNHGNIADINNLRSGRNSINIMKTGIPLNSSSEKEISTVKVNFNPDVKRNNKFRYNRKSKKEDVTFRKIVF